MALHEITLPSANGRDEIQAWLHVPPAAPRGIVQIVHGLGEHSRRYLHVISALVDDGFAVLAGDHAGHGATAMRSGVWADAGDEAARVVVEDELALQARAREILPGLSHVLYGHSWGSMIARVVAIAPQAELAGLILGGIAAQMRGIEASIDRESLAALATGAQRADPAPEEFVGQLFDGFLDRFGEDAGPTAWVALDEDVVADHGRDPLNNFGAPMSARFLQGFVDVYDRANSETFYSDLPAGLPVLILAGDQDPVANYGEGALHVANRLHEAGHADVRTRIYPGVRHEVHNEPTTRDDVVQEILAFADRVTEG
ncbi:alpha/beta fold hydrolase [Brachybacterium paraconglomeratum]|uniref:alpha/beta fold hydrolase n=1 Tax=Brachybacterium paraconglomeratum TaxID=173362 RepID=UPI0022AFD5A6|nr:alpha/beta fold hydrolase [Brachybacterium paraconglomeratum]MCZ4326128.1 alpha/beta fold hydrolase [Brachybacterium paraconglomeratum]